MLGENHVHAQSFAEVAHPLVAVRQRRQSVAHLMHCDAATVQENFVDERHACVGEIDHRSMRVWVK